jgi:hypothetical protein
MTVSNILPDDKPTLVKTIAILTLINGIVNIFWGLVATATVVPTIILACLAVFTILPTVLGVFEVIYAAKLLADPMGPTQPSQPIAIFEILCVLTGNVFSMIVGILSLVFYNDPQVKDFFARLNGMPVPAAPVPVAISSKAAAPEKAVPSPVEAAAPKSAPKAQPADEPKKSRQPKAPAAASKAAPEKEKPRKPKAPATASKTTPETGKPKATPKSGSSSS